MAQQDHDPEDERRERLRRFVDTQEDFELGLFRVLDEQGRPLQPKPGQLVELTKLIDAGHLKPIVTTVLPLSEARWAYDFSQSRHTRGKIVLYVRE